MDKLSAERRSWNMSRIRASNTRPELAVRSFLHRAGFRFRLHRTDLPGKPDIVLPRHHVAVFVHGCFWHRHSGCKFSYTPKTRLDFWRQKFDGNLRRDKKSQEMLTLLGWKVFVVWECETQNATQLAKALAPLISRSRRLPATGSGRH